MHKCKDSLESLYITDKKTAKTALYHSLHFSLQKSVNQMLILFIITLNISWSMFIKKSQFTGQKELAKTMLPKSNNYVFMRSMT